MIRRLLVRVTYWTGDLASKLIGDRFYVPGAFRYYQWAMGWSVQNDHEERLWKPVE